MHHTKKLATSEWLSLRVLGVFLRTLISASAKRQSFEDEANNVHQGSDSEASKLQFEPGSLVEF